MDSGVLFLNSCEQDRASREIVDKRGEKDLLFSPFSDVYRRIPLPTGVSLWNLFFDEIIAGCIVSPIDEQWKQGRDLPRVSQIDQRIFNDSQRI